MDESLCVRWIVFWYVYDVSWTLQCVCTIVTERNVELSRLYAAFGSVDFTLLSPKRFVVVTAGCLSACLFVVVVVGVTSYALSHCRESERVKYMYKKAKKKQNLMYSLKSSIDTISLRCVSLYLVLLLCVCLAIFLSLLMIWIHLFL